MQINQINWKNPKLVTAGQLRESVPAIFATSTSGVTDKYAQIATIEVLSKLSYVNALRPVETNIVIFDVIGRNSAGAFIDYLNKNNINASSFGPETVRFVTHLDISEEMIEHTITILENYSK